MNTTRSSSEKTWWRSNISIWITSLIISAILITITLAPRISPPQSTTTSGPLLLRTAFLSNNNNNYYTPSNSTLESEQLATIVHYATSRIVPQQSQREISISFEVLRKKGPSNFLVYGLGLDSQMWAAINPGGYTLFLEEDHAWYKKVMEQAPYLNARSVKYRTQLREAWKLLREYMNEPDCTPSKAYLRGNTRCRLALNNLPSEVYDREWDLIMIDAPKGYFPEAPGRMAAIFSAAVMARNRKGEGPTHVFLHDVNRPVERQFALEFLCKKNRVAAVGRLWHFVIPPAKPEEANHKKFC